MKHILIRLKGQRSCTSVSKSKSNKNSAPSHPWNCFYWSQLELQIMLIFHIDYSAKVPHKHLLCLMLRNMLRHHGRSLSVSCFISPTVQNQKHPLIEKPQPENIVFVWITIRNQSISTVSYIFFKTRKQNVAWIENAWWKTFDQST